MLQAMNRKHADRNNHDSDLEARIEALELAFRIARVFAVPLEKVFSYETEDNKS
jgi:hypothetical protein